MKPYPRYIVVCLGDDDKHTVMATHRLFSNRQVANLYAGTLARSREPIVIELLKPLYEEGDDE